MPLRCSNLSLEASLAQLIALLVGLWVLAGLHDFFGAEVGFAADYSSWGVLSLATASYCWLASLALILALDRGGSQFVRVATASVATLIVQLFAWVVLEFVADFFALSFYQRYIAWIWYAFLAWEIAVFGRILLSVYDAPLLHSMGYTAVYAGVTYAALVLLPHNPMFVAPWTPPRTDPIDIESVYYAQENLLRQRVFALSPQRPDVVDLYFVGFAAYAHQDVFKREIEQATVIFEQHYNSIGRTVALINNPQTIHARPLANRHNLDKIVRGIGEKIDREQDIVVVFLSSHGDDDATISVNFRGFSFNDVSASDVRTILDENKIKWRIVIVSACYSGSFIESLASPETMIVTAAAADRTSFGCAHENEWTYFGEAFFGHALKQSKSLQEAFELANARITQREIEEGKEPSLPQISTGAAIEKYLGENGL